MTVFILYLRGHLCDSLYFLCIGFHAFFTEYGSLECDLGMFNLMLSAIEYKSIVDGYLH